MMDGNQDSGVNIARLRDWRRIEEEIRTNDPELARWMHAREAMKQKLVLRFPPERVEALLQDYNKRWYHARILDDDFAQAQAEKGEIVATIRPILTRIDPVGFSTFPGYPLEYHFDSHYFWEAGLIALQLDSALTPQTLEQIITDAFRRTEGLRLDDPFTMNRFAEAASTIWNLFQLGVDGVGTRADIE